MKKYTAKHPDGTTYELTLEEMQSPQIIQQLQIDSSWSVKMGEKWESFNAFLWEQNQVHSQKPAEKRIKNIDRTPSITGPMLQANAHWNPCSVFGLTLRLIGLYFALKGLSGLVDFVVGYSHIQSATNQIIQHSSIKPSVFITIIGKVIYITLGLYLIRRAHRLVSFAFPENQ